MREEGKHLKAFEIYYSIGDNRTMKELERHPDITVKEGTLHKCSKEFDWKERIKERDQKRVNAMKRSNSEENEKAFRIYQNTIREVLKRDLIIPLKNGEIPINIKDMGDVVKLMKMDVELSGGITKAVNEGSRLREKEQKIIDEIQNKESWDSANKRIKVEK